MKRIIMILIAVVAFYTQADAMGNRSYNANKFGSKDNQRKHEVVTVDPDRPVHQVPEPGVIYLLGAGLAGLAWARRDRGGNTACVTVGNVR